jgi:hypothetical protein
MSKPVERCAAWVQAFVKGHLPHSPSLALHALILDHYSLTLSHERCASMSGFASTLCSQLCMLASAPIDIPLSAWFPQLLLLLSGLCCQRSSMLIDCTGRDCDGMLSLLLTPGGAACCKVFGLGNRQLGAEALFSTDGTPLNKLCDVYLRKQCNIECTTKK